MSKFKSGDRVRVRENYEVSELVELEGVILDNNHSNSSKRYIVSFENIISEISEEIRHKYLHSCSGSLPVRTGRFFSSDEIELVKRPRKRTPVIKRKGYALWIHNIERKRK
jgi:hypothetical protein